MNIFKYMNIKLSTDVCSIIHKFTHGKCNYCKLVHHSTNLSTLNNNKLVCTKCMKCTNCYTATKVELLCEDFVKSRKLLCLTCLCIKCLVP